MAVDALCDAFAEYPVMRFVLGLDQRPAEKRLRALIEYFVEARILRGEPILAVIQDGRALAAALVSYPDGTPSPPELQARAQIVWQELGAEARARYEAFGVVTRRFTIDVPHIHLNMLGVRREHQGNGFGRTLLERVDLLSRERPESQGVTLTTEDPGNVALYERFGYRVVAHARVADGLASWGMFKSLVR